MNQTKPINIILLGDPAAGKATQSEFLAQKFSLYDLDMGKELRKLKARDKKIKAALEGSYDKGKLTQTSIVQDIYRRVIPKISKRKGILFDGNPKMLTEAKLINGILKQEGRKNCILIYLSIPIKETIGRMSDRVEYFKGKYSKRTDDNHEALKNRIAYYRINVAAVIKFFKAKYPYKKISGMGSREEVQRKIIDFITYNIKI